MISDDVKKIISVIHSANDNKYNYDSYSDKRIVAHYKNIFGDNSYEYNTMVARFNNDINLRYKEFSKLYMDLNSNIASIEDCMFVASIINSQYKYGDTDVVLERIKNIFTRLWYINDNSGPLVSTPYDMLLSYSTTFNTGVSSNTMLMDYLSDIPVVCKYLDQGGPSNYQQLHEYIVGTKINELRQNSANWVYTYGYSLATNPMFNNNDFVATGLFNKFNDDCQIYVQWLPNAIPLSNIDSDSVYSIYNNGIYNITGNNIGELIFLQCTSQLLYAYKKYGFVHHDLNSGNIMLVTLDEIKAIPISVPINIDENGTITFAKYYIFTDLLAVIIDFGFSSINIPEYEQLYGTKVVSETNYYEMFEFVSSFENDFFMLLLGINKRFPLNDFYNILGNFILNKDIGPLNNNDEISSLLSAISSINYRYINPDNKYYLDNTIVKYCTKYANKWGYNLRTENKTIQQLWNIYPNILSGSIVDSIELIDDPRMLYLDNLRTNGTKYEKLSTEIYENEWFRQTYIINKKLYPLSYIKFFKYTNTFNRPLNMEPIIYNQPIDFLTAIIDNMNVTSIKYNENANNKNEEITRVLEELARYYT